MSLPFYRELKEGSKGDDVFAVKRALGRAKYMKLAGLTRTFGRFSVIALKRFQKDSGLASDGVYGPKTHAKLLRYFDAYSESLYAKATPEKLSVRDLIVKNALYFASIEPRVHYTQSSLRMSIVNWKLRPPVPEWRQVYEDCSSFATGCYWLAGAPDPNGRRYDGQGYTGTLWPRGRRVVNLQPGDLVFYGWDYRIGAPEHVAVYYKPDLVISHGSEGGPVIRPIHYRGDMRGVKSYL